MARVFTPGSMPPGVLHAGSSLPERRWLSLTIGTVLLLSVYYVNYGGEFHEGAGDSSMLATVARLLSVGLIAGALRPFRLRASPAWLLVALYGAFAFSQLLGAGLSGELNDALFFNTIIQLPILVALITTTRRFDSGRWFRVMSWCLAAQGVVDAWVWFGGESLWISKAFVGGFGNPSAFGLACVVACTFNLFHPGAGRFRRMLAVGLGGAAVMSLSLFSVLSLAFVWVVWMSGSRRRVMVGVLAIAVGSLAAQWWFSGDEDETFVVHKISAATAFLGLIDYDVDSSATVSVRSDMHARTFSALAAKPAGLLFGHLEGKAYWPMDSQLLTYLGSFGAVCLALFLALHLVWIIHAWRRRRRDGGFAFLVLLVFAAIFATNRILDYFPMAAIYFLCLASALGDRHLTMRSAGWRQVAGAFDAGRQVHRVRT